MDLEIFLNDIRQDIIARADSQGDFSETAFMELVAEFLIDTGSVTDFIPCSYKHKQRGVKVDGYAFVPEEATLDLFVCEFQGENRIEKINMTELIQAYRRVENFFDRSLTSQFSDELEVSHPASGLARQIFDEAEKIERVRFFMITNKLLSEKITEISSRKEAGREWSYRVWDLDRLSKVMTTGTPEEILVDFEEMFGTSLRCLPACLENAELQSYLAVIPGDWLAKIYDRYAGRLLEQNVRTFLQLRGKVNKGIRNTILKEPENFFPYNNGISATAEEAVLKALDGVVLIKSLRNMQIVNGGQTTATIFNSMKRDKGAPVETLRVQMKLTVVGPERVTELVPKISRFANSQNKVNDADFFSNHPFHVRLEGFSRKLWAPAVGGSQIQTHWFYERASGQYANEQAYLTPAKKREFILKNPRTQVVKKTELAKYENTFRQLPRDVSLGAQKNFAKFAEYVGERWQKADSEFSELWFQQAISRALIFRTTEKLVINAAWYSQGYRANTVTYGISYLLFNASSAGLAIDLTRIWQRQDISDAFKEQLLLICEKIQDRIIAASAANGVSNVTEWCKRPGCWDDIKKLNVPLTEAFCSELINMDDSKEEVQDGKRSQRLTSGVEAQVRVNQLGPEYWQNVIKWSNTERRISPSDSKILSLAASAKVPNARQSFRLLDIASMYDEDVS